jgi:ATP synthase protein I
VLVPFIPSRQRTQAAKPDEAFFFMKEDTRRSLRELAYFSSIGLSVALSIFIGLAIGLWLDRKFGMSPWLMFTGLGMGIAAGYRNIGLAIKRSRKL